ncbi:hypothetical protein [uncultured Psychrosphaera sp.]|uniref:hypothetical protein n=1 Tax=uncultured Psychrosphaera sp. TaxID=1403522 RepID=UPI00262A6DD3|nr:hypothetical protein [uncultured Psychrosphaera sp.]
MKNVDALKALRKERSMASPFPNLIDFESWADNVIPLLSFNTKIQSEFKQAVTSAVVSSRMNYGEDAHTSINDAIGILNQAILLPEPQESVALINNELKAPEKLTIPWLIQHVEIKHWVMAITIVFASFSAGVYFGGTDLYKSFSVSQKTQKNISGNP